MDSERETIHDPTMKLKEVYTDDSAVSPVIGVILMVAITVILAAVIGAFVLNLGSTQASAPTAKYTCDGTALDHAGGDPLQASNLDVSSGSVSASGEITAGETIDSDFGDNQLIWKSPNSDKTQILADRDCS